MKWRVGWGCLVASPGASPPKSSPHELGEEKKWRKQFENNDILAIMVASELLDAVGCGCGVQASKMLDFHHFSGKIFALTHIFMKGGSTTRCWAWGT